MIVCVRSFARERIHPEMHLEVFRVFRTTIKTLNQALTTLSIKIIKMRGSHTVHVVLFLFRVAVVRCRINAMCRTIQESVNLQLIKTEHRRANHANNTAFNYDNLTQVYLQVTTVFFDNNIILRMFV